MSTGSWYVDRGASSLSGGFLDHENWSEIYGGEVVGRGTSTLVSKVLVRTLLGGDAKQYLLSLPVHAILYS